MKITVLAIGKARGVEAEWAAEYQKRLGDSVAVKEFAVSKSLPPSETQKAEAQLLLKNIPPKSLVVLLDERGKDMTSREFAAKISQWQDRGLNDLVFMIGGADGVTDDIRQMADFTLGFGKLTWPHRLVRVMLLEQIYRAKQIIAGHPYHRD
ncbi:MAG: 23S rRNA (pseudouridine(1915)-N(3))-methyltransferase RlmH [Alphaproteobacteria bacterium]|nr:23S rRNA (pseudouridine(1915)-N(3))-methyltransferase RlmH [Alphaproteobacteria bacterium]